MSLIGRMLDRLTGRRTLTAVAADARRAAKLAADVSGKSDAVRAQLSAMHTELKRELAALQRGQADLREDLRKGQSDLRQRQGDLRQGQADLSSRSNSLQREVRERMLQYHLQLGRLARSSEHADPAPADGPALAARNIPFAVDEGEPLAWEAVGGEVGHPDPAGQEWIVHDRCPVCDHGTVTIVNPWNKLLLLRKAPDATSIRYDFAVCHACGVLSAMRRPFGARFKFLLAHFDEVTAKAGEDEAIGNPLLNPAPLSAEDRDELRRLAGAGVFVSDHLETKEYLSGLMRDRFENSGHVDIIGSLLSPRNARVLEVRARTGSLLDGLRRHWNADVYAMPIWESQKFLVGEVYGIPASGLIDFDRFRLAFDGQFDLIILQHMFTHVVRPREFFAELRGRLKPGGHIYFHNEPDDVEFLGGGQSMIAMLNPLHMQAFDQRSWVRGLAANGFETIFLKRHDDTHLCLARMSADVRMTPIEARALKRRITAYERAYDRAILRLDVSVRPRVADEWPRAVERAVASGVAEFDAAGHLRLVAR